MFKDKFLNSVWDRIRLTHIATKQDLRELRNEIMSAISDYANQVGTVFGQIGDSVDKLTKSVEGVSKDVQLLKDKIDKLQNSPGEITPEDQALLNGIQEQANQLSQKVKAASDSLAQLDAATEEAPTPEGGGTEEGGTPPTPNLGFSGRPTP